jgi:phosphatidylinositol alpha-1,6-mannosyltransferase
VGEPIFAKSTLAAISLQQGGDGVAYAALLLRQALADITQQEPREFELSPGSTTGTTIRERVTFLLRVGRAQVTDRRGWWVFNHVGIARAQAVIPRFARSRYAVVLCGIEAWDPDLGSTGKKALRDASTRIAISHHTAIRTAQAHPDIGAITECPLGLLPDLPNDSVIDRALLARVRERNVLIVGRMSASERYKGHDELIESWPLILQSVPDAQLIIAGRGDDLTRLREKAGALGISDHVLFLGFVPSRTLEELLKRATVFAMPSRGEGFGLVYLEAMRASLPCVASTKDAGAELVIDGETGFLVNPADRAAIAITLVRLLTTPQLASRLGLAGRRRFENEFTFERFRERLSPILHAAFP